MSDKSVKINTKKHVLIDYGVTDEQRQKYMKYIENFCGTVFTQIDDFNKYTDSTKEVFVVYVCGDVQTIFEKGTFPQHVKKIYVVKELSTLTTNCCLLYGHWFQQINIGEVPINVHDVGVFFPRFFHDNRDYFAATESGHNLQSLTESNKPGHSFRKGIYLTQVQEDDLMRETWFKLLRCSTNLSGPTVGFRETDNYIVGNVHMASRTFLENSAVPNHVLAQIYYNSTNSEGKEKKAKIKEHSDKTKDMPKNGFIAFCSFYKEYSNGKLNIKTVKQSPTDLFDYCYKTTSVLTRLRFRLKEQVTYPSLVEKFEVVLYPNSLFLIPLLTNRLYTHEIIPSGLPIEKLPTRLGYVVRCSDTDAVFKDGETYIVRGDKRIKLEEPTEEGVKELKDRYFIENSTTEVVSYDNFYFSMNRGDYTRPIP